jgi:hypothetical protein
MPVLPMTISTYQFLGLPLWLSVRSMVAVLAGAQAAACCTHYLGMRMLSSC